MEITGLLFNEITVLFLIMALGFLLVRLGILKSADSRVLSMVMIYLICPGVILKSFQIDFTPDVRDKFLTAAFVALAVNLILMLITWGYGKLFRLDAVERASIMYANTGNLIIPLVMAILGDDWVIYASAFMCVQQVFLWTHARTLIGGGSGISWKRILLNINLTSVMAGLVLLLTGIRLPTMLNNVCGKFSNTMGPLSMIMIGMLLADVKWGELLKLSGVASLTEDGKTLIYISFMAVITPCAATITQLAQMHRNRPAYAGALNALTTLASIVTMPLMTALYWLVI